LCDNHGPVRVVDLF